MISSSAKQYNVKVLAVSDIAMAMNTGSRVPRKQAVLLNIEVEPDSENALMVLIGYAEDATKYMANLIYGDFYTLDLIGRNQTQGKTLCIEDRTVFYKLAPNSKIRPYFAASEEEDRSAALIAHSILDTPRLTMSSMTKLEQSSPDDIVHVFGVVMSVTSQVMKFSVGTKIILADENGLINIMFFEGKPTLMPGSSLLIVGGRVWINPKTGGKEMSIYSSALVCTNQLKLSKRMEQLCRKQLYSTLVNVSAPPTHEVKKIGQLVEESRQMHGLPAKGTVMMRLDPGRQSQIGPMTYNGCLRCRKKVKQLAEMDENGNNYYDHDNESFGQSHKALSYVAHFYFSGRFIEDNEETIHLAQVDDSLGLQLLGCTADELADQSEEKQAEIIKRATDVLRKFNVSVGESGNIESILLIE